MYILLLLLFDNINVCITKGIKINKCLTSLKNSLQKWHLKGTFDCVELAVNSGLCCNC